MKSEGGAAVDCQLIGVWGNWEAWSSCPVNPPIPLLNIQRRLRDCIPQPAGCTEVAMYNCNGPYSEVVNCVSGVKRLQYPQQLHQTFLRRHPQPQRHCLAQQLLQHFYQQQQLQSRYQQPLQQLLYQPLIAITFTTTGLPTIPPTSTSTTTVSPTTSTTTTTRLPTTTSTLTPTTTSTTTSAPTTSTTLIPITFTFPPTFLPSSTTTTTLRPTTVTLAAPTGILSTTTAPVPTVDAGDPACAGTQWNTWLAWSDCTDTCGSCGTHQRFRACTKAAPTCKCPGSAIEKTVCNTLVCKYPRSFPCCDNYAPFSQDGNFVCVLNSTIAGR